MPRLENRVAVVSGGTSGIGLATAQRFAQEGAHVFIFSRRQEALDKALDLIGASVTAIQADASKLEDLDRVADAVRSQKGQSRRCRLQCRPHRAGGASRHHAGPLRSHLRLER